MKKMSQKRYRNICFTWNNYSDEDVKNLELFGAEQCSYFILGFEIGETGTPHIQGYMEFKGQKGFNWIKNNLPKIHFEARRGTSQRASDYCKKGDQSKTEWNEWHEVGPNWGKNANFIEKGRISNAGRRTDIEVACDMITDGFSMKDVAIENPNTFVKYHRGLEKFKCVTKYSDRVKKPIVIFIHGKSGTGKTRYVFDNHSSIYVKDNTKWWDGYEQQEVILIDDFNGRLWDYNVILRLLDRYPYQGETKGGYIKINSDFIYITSEFPPEHFYTDYENDNHLYQVMRRIDKVLFFE